jgi:hypothetical protein
MSTQFEGGTYTGTDLSDKVFYGFRLDNATGDLTVEVVDDGTVIIPDFDDGSIDANSYKTSIWTRNTLNFEFNNSNGHLHLVFI